MNKIAIIGASGGIGRAITQQYIERHADCQLWATYRTAIDVERSTPANVHWLPLDLENDRSIADFADSMQQATDSLDLLLICSGWLHDDQHMPEKSLRDLSTAAFDKALRINASAPIFLAAKLAGLLTRPAGGDSTRAKLVMLSAKVGSITDNSLGGWYAYRMSKAALNMGVRNLGIEFSRSVRKPIATAVHPGTTHSALSEPFAKRGLKTVTADVAAQRICEFVDNMSGEHQGGLFHWDGSEILW